MTEINWIWPLDRVKLRYSSNNFYHIESNLIRRKKIRKYITLIKAVGKLTLSLVT